MQPLKVARHGPPTKPAIPSAKLSSNWTPAKPSPNSSNVDRSPRPSHQPQPLSQTTQIQPHDQLSPDKAIYTQSNRHSPDQPIPNSDRFPISSKAPTENSNLNQNIPPEQPSRTLAISNTPGILSNLDRTDPSRRTNSPTQAVGQPPRDSTTNPPEPTPKQRQASPSIQSAKHSPKNPAPTSQPFTNTAQDESTLDPRRQDPSSTYPDC